MVVTEPSHACAKSKRIIPNPVKRYGELPTSIILSKWNPVCWEVLPVAHIHILLSTTWPDADQVEEGGSTTNSPGWVINSMTFFMSERVSVRSKMLPLSNQLVFFLPRPPRAIQMSAGRPQSHQNSIYNIIGL